MTAPEAPSRRDRKRRNTQDHLANSAARLFHAHGFDAVTMEQIAVEADVARGTLYNHFPVKEAALAHWIHMQLAHDMQHLATAIDPHAGFVPNISLILDASADWCEPHRVYLLPYLRFRMLESLVDRQEEAQAGDMIGAYAGLIFASQHAGQMRTDLSAAHLATMFHHLYLAALLRWLNEPGLSLREEFNAAVRLFVEGATPRVAKHPPRRKRA
ncbi:TetR/AcrR family transcriptional regulator [Dyella flagellata]|uniref:TetR family transcriptional regulator n=1 Tax=Dyella flagellata TaxID=1867833 RepID=A0ABQ5XEX2_9GAMM|nr:TetR/AcrR family transcriptional regulator [Dyella flagellata]GLQ90235.1 TetR family transcriptional regulator [Dyella flagellata]